MTTAPAGISVLVPVYRSTTSLSELVRRIEATLDSVCPFEIILVDDGSPSDTWEAVTAICATSPAVRGIRLRRNFGQHNALLAALRHASYPISVTLDDDLQNPPEEISRLIDALIEGDLDVVYGVPEVMHQAPSRRLAGKLNRRLLRSGLGVKSAPDFSSFRAFRTELREGFVGELGNSVSIDSLLSWGAGRYGSCTVRHEDRAYGSSGYSFGKLQRHAIDIATGYSTFPLQSASVLGLATTLFGMVVLVYVVLRQAVSGQSVPGFTFLVAMIAIFSGVQLICLGVIGEYLARMHFRIMRKPSYLIAEFSNQSRNSD